MLYLPGCSVANTDKCSSLNWNLKNNICVYFRIFSTCRAYNLKNYLDAVAYFLHVGFAWLDEENIAGKGIGPTGENEALH